MFKNILLTLSILLNIGLLGLLFIYFHTHYMDWIVINDTLSNRWPWLCEQAKTQNITTGSFCAFLENVKNHTEATAK